jgi:hypothetical protein
MTKRRELHLYDADRRWVGGGPILPNITHDEALARVARFVLRRDSEGPEPDPLPREGGRPRFFQWSGDGGNLRPLPKANEPGQPEPVFAGDARDRHLVVRAP